MNGAGCGGNRINRPHDQPRPGKPRQFDQINPQLFAPIVARDKARQHARIRRFRCGINHGQAHARQWLHPPFAQDQRMGMATTNKHKITGKGKISLHADWLAQVRAKGHCR